MTCRRLIDRGVIPATKLGGSIKIDMKKLDDQLECGIFRVAEPKSRKQ